MPTGSSAGMAGRFRSEPSKEPAPPPRSRKATRRKSSGATAPVTHLAERRRLRRASEIPPPWKHQVQTIEFDANHPRVYDTSDPGTGKTRGHLEAFRNRGGSRAVLVLAPKSLLRSAWGYDIEKFTPELRYSLAYAENREEAFAADADVYITNLDAAKWLAKQRKRFFDRFDTLIIDEITGYKHRTSQRSKAAAAIRKHFEYRIGMTGTPNSLSVTDTWNQMFLLDDGARLGRSFTHFRNQVCEPKQVGPSANHIRWMDREHAVEDVAALVQDLTIRHLFEECMDIPPNFTTDIHWEIPAKLRKKYDEMEAYSVLELGKTAITAVHAASLRTKLLQIASGAVYSGENDYEVLDRSRYQMILDLVEAREQCVVFFNWRHQRDELVKEAKARKVTCAVIDGSVRQGLRDDAVDAFQRGETRVIFLNPQTGAHGLTLTRGTSTIWSSPIYQPDFLKQGKHRIYRGGQTKKTETVLIDADNTVEQIVYARLGEKNMRMMTFLDLLHEAKGLRA